LLDGLGQESVVVIWPCSAQVRVVVKRTVDMACVVRNTVLVRQTLWTGVDDDDDDG